MSENRPLTAKQERFCLEYVANGFNGTRAAIAAGYSEESADVEGSRLLVVAKVRERIAELTKGATQRAKASADDVFEMLTDAINFDHTEFADIKTITVRRKTGDYERNVMILKCKLSELPPKVRRLVTGIKEGMFGVEVTWFSKEKAIEMISRFHGMNQDRVKVTTDYDTMTEAQLKALAAEKAARLGLKPDNEQQE